MVASVIAYFMSVLLFSLGARGLWVVASKKVPDDEEESTYICVSFAMLVAALICAKIGGI